MKKATLLNVLMFFPLLLETIIILFLPTEIPIHYDSNLQVTTYGSKYMLLIIGILIIIFGLFMKMIYKSNIGTDREVIVFRLCNIAFIVFNVINVWALIGAFL